MSSPVLTAVAWPYANGPRHIGHVSGFGVPADVFSRYQRMVGNDVLMVSGHRRARHPDPGAGRRRGRLGARARRPLQPGDRRRPAGPRALLRPVHPHVHPQPLRRGAGTVPHGAPQRLLRAEDHDVGHLAVDRPDAARPLHRGHLPDLRVRRRSRRPVRQLRQPARPDRPDQPALPDQRRDPEVRRVRALLPRPAGARRRARRLAADPNRLAAERAAVLAEPARRPPSAGDDPRHRLGHPGSARRLARPAGQEALRLVRRRHRLPVRVDRVGPPLRRERQARSRGLAALVAGRCSARSYYFMGKDNITFHSPDLAGRAARLRRQGRAGRRPGHPRRGSTCRPRWCPASS